MNSILKFALVPVVSAALMGAVQAQEAGTAEEAQAMLDEAVAHYEEVGREQALEDFNTGDQWQDRDLYVYCIGPDQTVTAHGANADLVGMSAMELIDPEGMNVGEAVIEVGQAEGSGTVDYVWENPQSGEVEPKSAFVQSVGDDICAVGYYQ
jgi:signal transduction histidine kinase